MFSVRALLLSIILAISLASISYTAEVPKPAELPSAYSSATEGVITPAREPFGLYTSGAAAESSLIMNVKI